MKTAPQSCGAALVRIARFELATSCLSSKRSKPTELYSQRACCQKKETADKLYQVEVKKRKHLLLFRKRCKYK